MLTKHCDNHFPTYVNQTIMLYTLNIYTDVCQLFLNKTENVKIGKKIKLVSVKGGCKGAGSY